MDHKVQPFGHEDDVPLRSTIAALEDFKESTVWRDILQYLNDRIEVAKHDALSNKVTNMQQLALLKGEVKALESLKELPDRFIQEIEHEIDQEDQDNG